MKPQLVIAASLIAFLSTSCVKRIPAYDEARKPISEREIEKFKTNKNRGLYALGGGAVSFGVSFFLGTLVDRGIDEGNNAAALWGTTAAGTALGTVFFASQGSIKDRNQAILKIRELRRQALAQEFREMKSKKANISKEMQTLEELKRRQEAEKKALEEEIKRKKKP